MALDPDILHRIKTSTTKKLYIDLENTHKRIDRNRTLEKKYSTEKWGEIYDFKAGVISELHKRGEIDERLFSDLHMVHGILSTYRWW